MIESKYQWKLISNKLNGEELEDLHERTGLSPIILKILGQRELTSSRKIQAFLNPDGSNFHDPFLLNDMDTAVERIQTAIMNGEKIYVYGDYDADGITSTAVMYETLLQLGADVSYYVPSRFEDGYGPNLDVYKQLQNEGMQLLITVDNGVSGYDEIQYLQENGIDVIVTDHHEPPEKIPNALAVVHPNHPQSQYPFKKLAGVGVAFKVACALLEEIPQELLDLVAIGTVADVVSLTDENRDLVSFGLKQLQVTSRLGLQALYKSAGVKAAEITSDTIGFAIAPRLNALGRIEDAAIGVQLLTTLDESEAKKLAEKTQKLNEHRQELAAQITKEAEKQLEDQTHKVNIVCGKDWHEGVLGIVASRLAEETQKPTIVLTENDDQILKGSARSVKGFNLFKAFDSHRKLFESFGGHELAAGLSLKKENLSGLQVIADQEVNNQGFDPTKKSTLEIAEKIDSAQISAELIEQIEQLAPFGTDNKRPVFEIEGINQPQLNFMGQQNQHIKIDFEGQSQKISAVKFNVAQKQSTQLQSESLNGIKLCGELALNKWRGKINLQVKIKDLKTSQQSQINYVDQRSTKLTQEMFNEQDLYGFFDAKILQQVQQSTKNNIHTVLLTANPEIKADKLVLVDCPSSIEMFKEIINQLHVNQIVLKCYTQHDIAIQKMPTHADFGKLYRFTSTHRDIDLVNQGEQLANYLQFNKELMFFMIKVFIEVGFVKVENGLMTGLPQSSHVDLTQTKAYQERIKKQEAQKIFLHANTSQLLNWLNGIN
ncbi:single-stranded-DNA-specific exonuclease RecJ [Ligilactobacillus sp. LYQ135]